MTRIIGIGDNVVDKYLHLDKMFPGGNALNVAVLSHRYGAESAYIGCLGTDFAGKHIFESLRHEGVDVSHIRFVNGPNAYARVTLVDGERVFLPGNPGVAKDIKLSEADYLYIKNYDLIHTSIYSGIDHELRQIRKTGALVSYDFSNMGEHRDPEKILPHIDVAVFSAGGKKLDEVKDYLMQVTLHGPVYALATRGEEGAILYHQGIFYEQPVIPVQVIDTLGAGDAFISRFLVGILEKEYLPNILSQAAFQASLVCGYLGAFGYGINNL